MSRWDLDTTVCRHGDSYQGEREAAAAVLRERGEFAAAEDIFVSQVIVYLDWLGVEVKEIVGDQWFAIYANREVYNPETKQLDVVWRARVQCDLVEDGFAGLLLAAEERFGKELVL